MTWKKPRVIGLLGRAGSGKSTAGTYIVEKYGAKRVSFAAPLKRLAQQIMDFTDEQLYGPQSTKEAPDPRYGMSATEFLQKLGNSAREEIKYDIWVEAALGDIAKLSLDARRENKEPPLFVIDDVRYINEAEAIATDDRFIGHVIKLVCPDATTKRDPNHPSEAQVDEVPSQFVSHVIVSKMSPESVDLLEKLEAALGAIFPGIGKKQEDVFSTTPVSMP